MKRILAALLLTALLLTLSGCHGTQRQSAFAVPDQFDESRAYELTFWAKNDTNKTQTEIYQSAIDAFEALYPNITVNLRLYTDYGKIYNDVITNIATGTTPNVCVTYPDHIATYLTGSNVVVPLDALFDDAKYGLGGSEVRFDAPSRDEIVPKYLEEGAFDGHYYAVPYMRSTEACFVNRDFVEALGFELPETLTWDFVWEVSEAATARDDDGNYLVNGQKVLIPFIYKSTDNMMIQMLRQKGTGYSDAEGNVLMFNDDTRRQIFDIAEHAKSGAFSTFKLSGYPANFLNAGQCIFAIDSTAGSTWMGSDAPLSDIDANAIVRFDTAVYPVPQYDPEHPQMISQGPSLCVFNKDDSQEVLASWLFTQFMLTNEVQIAYAETEGYVPVTTKARETDEYADYLSRGGEDNKLHYDVKIEATKMLLDNTENTFTTPVFNGSASLRDAAGQLIENAVKSVRRKKTVDDAFIDQLYADVTSLYRLDQLGGASGSAEKGEMGPLPTESAALLGTLAVIWVLIGVGALLGIVKRKKNAK